VPICRQVAADRADITQIEAGHAFVLGRLQIIEGHRLFEGPLHKDERACLFGCERIAFAVLNRPRMDSTGPYGLGFAPLASSHDIAHRFGIGGTKDTGAAPAIAREKAHQRRDAVKFSAPSEIDRGSIQIVSTDWIIKSANKNNFGHCFTFMTVSCS